MNSLDFTPEYSPEEMAFISARRYFTFELFKLLPLIRFKDFPEATSDYKILGSDSLDLREDNQHLLDGQQVQVKFKFTHHGKSHYFSVTLTNDENWNMLITMRSSVAPDRAILSGIATENLDAAYSEINHALLSILDDVFSGRVTKTRTQTLGITSTGGLARPQGDRP